MAESLTELAAKTGLRKPATDKQIASFVKKIGFQPPADYLDYLRITNGNDPDKSSANTADVHFLHQLHTIKDALAYTEDYKFSEAGPLVIIGTDGGGNAYCLDGRFQPPRIIGTEFGDCGSTDNSVDFGPSFTGFLRALCEAPEGKVWPTGLPPFSSADGFVRQFPVETDWSRPIDPVNHPELREPMRVTPLGLSPDGTMMVGVYLPTQPIEEGKPRHAELGIYHYPGGKLVRSLPLSAHVGRMTALTAELLVLEPHLALRERSWTLLNIGKLEMGPTFKIDGMHISASLASGKVVGYTAAPSSDASDGPLDIRLIDLDTGGEIRRFQTATDCFALQHGMLIQINYCRDGRVWMEDIESGKLLWETSLPAKAKRFFHFLFSPDAQTVLVHEVDGKIYGFRTSDGKKLFRSKMDFDLFDEWAWMSDSRRWLATRTNGRQICLLDGVTGELLVKCPFTAERAVLFPHPNGRDVLFHYYAGLHVWTLPPLACGAASAAP